MIIVYNKNLDNYHDITHAISVQMIEYYNDIGKATLVLPIDHYNVGIIENGAVIYDTEREMSFTVVNHKYDTASNTLTVNCYTCNWLLNNRVVANKVNITNIEQGVITVVNDNLRGLYKVSVGDGNDFNDATQILLYGGQVLDQIIPILEQANIGQKMRWDIDTKSHVFELYKGNNLTEGIHAVVFSEEQGTANNLLIAKDESIFKNYIYVPGELIDGTQIVVEVGDQNATQRCEKWLSGINKQENDEAEPDFRERLYALGLEEIARLVSRLTFSITIDPEEYGEVYKLGDIVSCVSSRFGIALTSRISGVKYMLDVNGEAVNLILGEPVLTAISGVVKNG